MLRRTVLPLIIATLLLVPMVVKAADPLADGCFVNAPASVEEGQTFTATVKCNSVNANVFGFEFGTTFTAPTVTVNGSSAPAATQNGSTYTAGDFAPSNFLVGTNSLNGLYAVSHEGSDNTTGTFTLGSFTATVPYGLVADSSATIHISSFKLSDNLGAPINGQLQASPDTTVTITNKVIPILSGNVTVRSDGSVSKLETISLDLDSANALSGHSFSPFTKDTTSGSSYAFNVSNLTYAADHTNIAVSASMKSHLACSKSFTLVDGANNAATKVGTITLKAGDVVSVGGDTAINIQDATAIGSAFGTSSTDAVDVNGDGTVDIYDLVHVGRNYGATQGTCN
jgi:hypothetical protein